jgi:hypothetical protein
MTAAERVTAAFRGDEVDYTPCVPFFWGGHPRNQAFVWKNEEERIAFHLEELGVDTALLFALPHKQPPFQTWVEHIPGQKYPLIHNEVETPKGKLKAVLKKATDYPGQEIPFFSDWTVSRYVKPWIETWEDAEKFASIYMPPDDSQLARAKDRLAEMQKMAQRWNIPIVGTGFMSLNAMIHLMGAEQAVLLSVDSPDIIDFMNEVVYSVNRKKLEISLSWGVKTILRNGWYDTADFWALDQYERWVVPHLEEDIDLVHFSDGIFIYQACTGLEPLLPILARLNFDCLLEPEPVLGRIDMANLKAALPGKSFWGGVSAPMHIGEGSPETVRQAVRDAFRAFGNKGFILKAVPSIRAHWPWENVLAMVNEWKRLRYLQSGF